MRALIVRWTAIVAFAVSTVVTLRDAASGAPWPVLVMRAGLAFAIIVLAGWVVGLVLMRTALRRHYEESRMAQAGTRPRPQR